RSSCGLRYARPSRPLCRRAAWISNSRVLVTALFELIPMKHFGSPSHYTRLHHGRTRLRHACGRRILSSVDGELARDADIRGQRAMQAGLPGPIVADAVRPRGRGAGDSPLHGVARAGKGREAVVTRPRVRRLPVPVIGYYRPGPIGVLLLDLQE